MGAPLNRLPRIGSGPTCPVGLKTGSGEDSEGPFLPTARSWQAGGYGVKRQARKSQKSLRGTSYRNASGQTRGSHRTTWPCRSASLHLQCDLQTTPGRSRWGAAASDYQAVKRPRVTQPLPALTRILLVSEALDFSSKCQNQSSCYYQ